MATAVTDIKSTNWQISTAVFGAVVQGLADIRQCLTILLATQKGADSLRPEFGSDLYKYIDYPVNIAVPLMKAAMIEAITIWETRIILVKITHTIQNENIIFDVTYKLKDEDITDNILYSTTDAAIVEQGLILQAFYPPNTFHRQYTISLILNLSNAMPAPPDAGFSSLSLLFSWVQANWGYYGRWVKLIDRIVLYATNDYSSGEIAIELIQGTLAVQAAFPALDAGQYYDIDFVQNADAPVPAYAGTFTTIEQVLLWVQANWAAYGSWDVVSGGYDVFGDFSTDYSDDFSGSGASYFLQLRSNTLNTATLNITAGG